MVPLDFPFVANHKDIDRSFRRLMAKLEGSDLLEARAAWLLFARELNEHFFLEERHLIAAFRQKDPAEAAALCREHVVLRGQLADLAVAVDVGFLRDEHLATFVAQLRAHAAREAEGLYEWAATSLPARAIAGLGVRLTTLSHEVSGALGPAVEDDLESRGLPQ